MHRRTALLCAALLCAALVTAGAAGAAPAPSGPQGRKCSLNSTTDVTKEAGWQTGEVNAGPLVTGEAGTLVCTIHVNNSVHSGSFATPPGPVTGAAVDGVAVVAPTRVDYRAGAADDVTLCTKWVGASGTLYWVSGIPTAGQLGHWTTDPNAACDTAITGPYDPECSIWKSIDDRAGTPLAETWQDCEAYDPII